MKPLREYINSEDYISRLENIEHIMGNIAGKTRILFPKYTNHGVDHLKNVEKHANNIIPDNIKEELSEEEIFCLICGIWLHDIGMVPIAEEIDIYENKSVEEREKYRIALREVHHIRSENYINKNHEKLGLNKLEAKIIGKIAKSHRKIKLSEIEKVMYNGKLLDIAALGAIVRLADECDISKNRETPLSSEGIDENTREKHYIIHDFVNDVCIDHENQTIHLSCIVENKNELKPIKETQNEIQEKLNQTKNYLKNFGIKLNSVKLDIHDEKLHEKEIICNLANYDFNIDEWEIPNTSPYKIQEILCNLKAESLFNSDEHSLGFKETFFVYKKLFKKFIGHYNLKNFYFTKYSQKMVEICFDKIENKFNAGFISNRKSRIEILKNTPTAFYLILIFEELIGDNKFRLNYNKNGELIVDFLLLMSLFNDTYYFNDQLDFKNVKKHVSDLIEDKNNLQEKINKNKKSIPLIESEDETGKTIPFSIKFNLHKGFEDYIDLDPTYENPIKILGDRIEYIEIGEGKNYKKYSPDILVITKPNGLELKINSKLYKLNFKKEILSKNSLLFTSIPSEELNLILRLKLESNFEENNPKISLSIIPKSNKIKDLLYQTKFKKECSEKDFEIMFEGSTIFKNKFPKINVEDKFINFLEKVDKINDYFKLNIIHEENYEITSKDVENAKILCSYIQTKTIVANDIRAKFEISISELNRIIQQEQKDIKIVNPQYNVNLLNKNIELGPFEVKINSLKILNKEKLENIVKSHDTNETVNVEIIMSEEKSDLLLNFNNGEESKPPQ